MRLLKRNITEFEYLPPTGVETDVNEDGDHTGDFHPTYGNPEIYRGNISSPSGHTTHQFFGEEIRYTHTLVMDDPETDIRETGRIRWKDELYDITAVRPSLNVLSVALHRLTKSEEIPDPEEEPEEEETPEEDGDGE